VPKTTLLKVMIGHLREEQGTVELTPQGLLYSGPDPEHVRAIVEHKRKWYDIETDLHTLTDEELVRSLPFRLQGRLWAVFVDEQGKTQDQSDFDPFGDFWWGDFWNSRYHRSGSPSAE